MADTTLLAVDMFVNDRGVRHESFVIAISYAFVFFGAWNDGLVGFTPTIWSHVAEVAMAALLALEIASRLVYTTARPPSFWLIIALDVVSVLTVVPGIMWVGFARLARLIYACVRLLKLLDRIALARSNALYLVILYPVTVPLVAAVVYALERHTKGSEIHNYFQALAVCFQFALSLGNVRPANAWAMALCGALFLVGIICVGVATNTISGRYNKMKSGSPK